MHIIYGNKICQSNTTVVMRITDSNEVCHSNTPVVMHSIEELYMPKQHSVVMHIIHGDTQYVVATL